MHTNKKYSIMYAIYEKENSGPEFELGWEDRKAVQRVYGKTQRSFTVGENIFNDLSIFSQLYIILP